LDEVDIPSRQAGGLIGALGRFDARIEGNDVLVAADPGRAAGLYGGEHVDGQIRRLPGAILGNDDDGGGPVTYWTAVIKLDGIGDRLRLADNLRSEVGAELGQLILQPVRLVLDHHRGDLIARGAVFGGVNAPGQAEQAGKGEPGGAVG